MNNTFQSTRPRGTRPHAHGRYQADNGFNPRVREGRDITGTWIPPCFPRFNPRVREGRDVLRLLAAAGRDVSIHASARDATRIFPAFSLLILVSIHASARDATSHWRGEEPESPVSIHASARDATRWHSDDVSCPVFQSTRPRGTRPQPSQPLNGHSGFNPRVREGRDRQKHIISPVGRCFNPRVREGRDNRYEVGAGGVLFQSTRPRGTRHKYL